MHLLWAPDVDTALAEATALLGEKATVTVIPDGVSVIGINGKALAFDWGETDEAGHAF